jgi:hypothetical protein
MNIAYIVVKNDSDRIHQQERIQKYCSIHDIKLDSTVIDTLDDLSRTGRGYILDDLLYRKEKISNLVLFDITSVGIDTGEALIFFSLLKNRNKTTIHVLDISIELTLKDVIFNSQNNYVLLQILTIMKELNNET